MNHNHSLPWIRSAWCLFIVGALMSCSFSPCDAAEKGGQTEMNREVIVASVKGNDMGAFEKAANDLYVERERLCQELVSILQDAKSSNFPKCSAAYYLGEMRMQDAVPALAANITLRQEAADSLVKRLPVMEDYPVVQALVKIGKASTKHMIQNLEDNADSLVRELSARVMRGVEGSDLARILVQRELTTQANPVRKERLQAALLSKYFADAQ